MLYQLVFKHLLVRVPAETAHHAAFTAIRLVERVPALRAQLAKLLAPKDAVLRTRALGLDLPGPLGLAAGFDKDALAPDALAAMGFGYVEIGTVTARPQPGNPKPRMFRLPADKALINRMGFNNHGSTAASIRLKARRGPAVVGVNIGKSKVVGPADAIEDYVASTARLGPVADYLVVNVSSPNTPGLRDLQAVSSLRPLLSAVRRTLDASGPTGRGTGTRRVPLLVKIAPDLSDDDVDAVADLAVELGLDGIIATNTTITRTGLRTPAADVEAMGAGGLSGAPVAERSLEVLRRLRARVGDEMVLVAAGGIQDGDDAYERIRAGATLVQAYTGFIYGGLFWPRQVQRRIAERLRADGFTSIHQAVGTAEN
ncbi:quinone-dependent dihydroorotate dehydrogenase [Kineosporia sp. NBRC 101731]|uniref:quinone-dependent dihydroorotate dehydrogenase n=1 Tax=Kineosporia sp. NBRC 101731 TaxID=3032199 RepID=UPI0024A547FB|nr:quinone-dependent dihydroorotate dehydrogenase [Kineosporia sp. NBRC 101731]GLY28033.1 dihydroorotate dehydrogenase (quinone) [Kineosporia sp. NBRC 101731]